SGRGGRPPGLPSLCPCRSKSGARRAGPARHRPPPRGGTIGSASPSIVSERSAACQSQKRPTARPVVRFPKQRPGRAPVPGEPLAWNALHSLTGERRLARFRPSRRPDGGSARSRTPVACTPPGVRSRTPPPRGVFMATKIGINGFGRIGRCVLRALVERKISDVEIVGINDLTDTRTLAHLLKYDSIHRTFKAAAVGSKDSGLSVGGKDIAVTAIKDPKELPWKSQGVDIVLECTGIFTDKTKAVGHVE